MDSRKISGPENFTNLYLFKKIFQSKFTMIGEISLNFQSVLFKQQKINYITTWWVLQNLLKNDFWRPGISFKVLRDLNDPWSSRWLCNTKAVLGPIAGNFCNICKLAEFNMFKMLELCLSWSKMVQFVVTSRGFLKFFSASILELRLLSLGMTVLVVAAEREKNIRLENISWKQFTHYDSLISRNFSSN